MILKTISAVAFLLASSAYAEAWTTWNQYGGTSNANAGAAANAAANALSRSRSSSNALGVGFGGNAVASGGIGLGGSANSRNTNVVNVGNGGGNGLGWGAATVVAPSGNNTAECQKYWSFGISGGPGGLAFGIPNDSEDCQRRRDIAILWSMHERRVARKLACQSSRIAQAAADAGLRSCRGVVSR